ncbi:putative oxidoreductase [Paraliobacillus sp. PM-2]|uniref:SDR family NAD(P)-dependent oxidoreductase n=1 Tax=Paraliobacillus sp. PM-2 TaxID=1462524 RepID=UPI00061C3E8C|nr:SDR family oxidoreductase [Paraliobacillus sp. PM-2]CQR46754.1 putative oxidoreductase [Paraliobacillus sp. PM-2]
MRNFSDKTILITGASSGIGEGLARALAARGANLILIARSTDKLHALKQSMEHDYSIQCDVYSVDLANKEARINTLKNICKQYATIDALINNAGFGIFDSIEEAKTSDMEQMFQVNVFALIESVKQLLPLLTAAKKGHIINIASFAGKIATPKSSIYGATKHAVLGFSNALRLEVEQRDLYVTTVNLGPVKTNFFQTADPSGNYQKNVERYMLDSNDVVDAIVQALFKRKREINLPKWMEFGSRLYHLFPKMTERILKKQFNKK